MVAKHQNTTATKMATELNAAATNKIFKGGIYGPWCIERDNKQDA